MSTTYTRDKSSGRVHKRLHDEAGNEFTLEADNLDDAGAFETITDEQLADVSPEDLCRRCFSDVHVAEPE